MIVIGSGLAGGAVVYRWHGHSATAPGSPRQAGGRPEPSSTTRQFTGDIRFVSPGYGNTLFSGQRVSGTVTGWTAGYQVWLFVRPDGSSAVIARGPCQVGNGRWTCMKVQFPGAQGALEYLQVVVAPDRDAATYPTLSALPQVPVYDQTAVYKPWLFTGMLS